MTEADKSDDIGWKGPLLAAVAVLGIYGTVHYSRGDNREMLASCANKAPLLVCATDILQYVGEEINNDVYRLAEMLTGAGASQHQSGSQISTSTAVPRHR